MFIREENLENYLTEQYTTSFNLNYLSDDLNETPTLQTYTIIYAWCYQSGVHEFLMLHLTCPCPNNGTPKKDIWMRVERMPKFPRAVTVPSSRAFPANDVYSMNYDYGVALKGEDESIKAVAAIGQFCGLSVGHIVELGSIIHNISGEWEPLDTNCRWFCAVTLRALEARFNGAWMMGGAKGGFFDFCGEEGRLSQMVWKHYCSKKQSVRNINSIDRANNPESNETASPLAGLTWGSTLTNTIEENMAKSTARRGIMGLPNLADNCYMNSAIQCLIHIPELEEYFLSGLYKYELNHDNPLGTQGQIANAFSMLISYLYPPSVSCTSEPETRNPGSANPYTYAPRIFKKTLERFIPSFSSHIQQDTQEFLAVLLNGLHEDLNRVLGKPYVEKSGWLQAGDERVAAKEALKQYKKGNDSVITDLFQGIYKSTLVCPECQIISITFDPFICLTVPLSTTKPWRHTIYWVPWDMRKTPLAVKIEVPKGSSYGYLKVKFGRWFAVNPENLLAAEVWSHKFYKFYEDYMNLTELAEKDTLVVYELPVPFKSIAKLPPTTSGFSFGSKPKPAPKTDPNAPFLLPVFHFSEQQRNAAFGVPFFVLLTPTEASSREGIYRAVVDRCGRWTRHSGDMWIFHRFKEEERTEVTNENEERASPVQPEDEDAFEVIGPQANLFDLKLFNSVTTTGIETGFNMNSASVRWVDWDSREQQMQRNLTVLDPTEDESAALAERPPAPVPLVKPNDALVCQWSHTMQSHFFGPDASLFDRWEDFTHRVDIEDCLDDFTREEQLGEDDLWYCPQCKKHQQATKRIELWSVPDILVVHLKRFSNARAMRDKIAVLVEFPITGLDLNKRVGEGAESGECMYDLFAVDEHMGGLGEGHYRAYVKNLPDNEWYHFDDSHVSKSSAEDCINAYAYLLFYRRRASEPKAVIDKVHTHIASESNPEPDVGKSDIE